jgi:predicted TIM-barrel fold metal-dependent hydrolase
MIIDSHAHISLYNGNANSLEEAFLLFLDTMKENNIDAAIIIPGNIENSKNIVDLENAIKLIGEHRNIFLLGSPQIIQRGFSEIEKYRQLLESGKVKGLKFFPGHDPYYPNDKRCWPYYELCQNLKVPVLFHTGENSDDSECARFNDPKYIVMVAKKYPKLKIIITHYYWPQLDYCYNITKDIKNIYFETAALADEEVVLKSGGLDKVKSILRQTINDRPDQVIFGTDWPMCSSEKHIELIKSLNLVSDVEEKILYKNSKLVYRLHEITK